MYNRYAESARVNWTRNFAAADPVHAKQWMELITPKSVGLILRSITTDYKFVSLLCSYSYLRNKSRFGGTAHLGEKDVVSRCFGVRSSYCTPQVGPRGLV
jgi:hypothetical protein